MDVTDLVLRLLRRWVAVLAVMALAGAAAAAAWVTAGSSQQSTATVVIVPPRLGEDVVSDLNPLLNLDNNLAQLATVLASALATPDPTERAELSGRSVGSDAATYTISTITGTNPSFAQLSPQLVFTVTASTPESAQQTAADLVERASTRLDEMQSQVGAPFLARARLLTVVAPTPAESAGSGRLRAGGAVGLGVGVLGLLGVLLADELLTRRRSRRTAAAPEVAS